MSANPGTTAPEPEDSKISVSIVIISKDEPALADTLGALYAEVLPGEVRRTAAAADAHDAHDAHDAIHETDAVSATNTEIVVVDASEGRLDGIRRAYPFVRWVVFDGSAAGARITIPHQRNAGIAAASGDVIVFIDSGCIPYPGWFSALLAPIRDGSENIVCGGVRYTGDEIYAAGGPESSTRYLTECPTINLAFRRSVAEKVGEFDESFEYGSDVDFSWRAVDLGFRIRFVADAAISHDWGGFRRQLKRSHQYGVARARLYRKHVQKLPRLLRQDSVALLYPIFILGLPLTAKYRAYPLLLAIPVWRNRRHRPLLTILDHLVYGLGVLSEVSRIARGAVTGPASTSARP